MHARTVALFAVASIAVAGCGSDADDPPAEAAGGAKAAYVGKVDDVCEEMRADQIAVSTRAGKTVPEQAAALREIADLHRGGMRRIEQLEAPADAAPVEAFATTVRDNADVLDQAAEVLEAGDTDRSRELVASIVPSTQRAAEHVKAYGARSCGQSG